MRFALSLLAVRVGCTIEEFVETYDYQVIPVHGKPDRIQCRISHKSPQVIGTKEITIKRYEISTVCYGDSASLKRSEFTATKTSEIPALLRKRFGVDLYAEDVVDTPIDAESNRIILTASVHSLQWFGSTTITIQD